jgi:hypothetical protein
MTLLQSPDSIPIIPAEPIEASGGRVIFTRNIIPGLVLLCGLLIQITRPGFAFAKGKSPTVQFGVGRGLTFYTSPELETFNSRLGNSPRLQVSNEFGRAMTLEGSYEFLNKTETLSWGFEGQQWAETIRGTASSGDENPRSEATLAFARVWLTGGIRLWPWVGPVIVKRNTNIFGRAVVMNKARIVGSGFFSHLRLATGPLLWRHDYLLSDTANQTLVDYASRTLSWEGGVRWSLGWRLGQLCDVGFDLGASRSIPLKTETVVGSYYLSGRDNSDDDQDLGVVQLSKSAWRTSQALMFVRFFIP